jgi:hypothetical protein
LNILQNPTRIFNGNETSSHFCPNPRKFLKCKGDKNAYEIDRGLANMLTFSPSGMMCPPMLI